MDKLRAVGLHETAILQYLTLQKEAREAGNTQEVDECEREIQRLEKRIDELMDWPDFKNANERFQARTITRKEYNQFSRLSRSDKMSFISPASDLHRHFQDGKQWVRWVKRCAKLREGDMFLYHAVSEGYAWRVDEAIADWGGSMWEAEIERAVSSYHFWGDSGGLLISGGE